MAENEKKILLEVDHLTKYFNTPKGLLHAVDGVSFQIEQGKTLGIVGESGCGKSTTGRLIDHLISPDSGEIWFCGKDISHIPEKEMRPLRADVQMIFQDPYGSLNPRIKIQDQLGEPLLLHTNLSQGERLKKVQELLRTVGLSASHGERYPHDPERRPHGGGRIPGANRRNAAAARPLDASKRREHLRLRQRRPAETRLRPFHPARQCALSARL